MNKKTDLAVNLLKALSNLGKGGPSLRVFVPHSGHEIEDFVRTGRWFGQPVAVPHSVGHKLYPELEIREEGELLRDWKKMQLSAKKPSEKRQGTLTPSYGDLPMVNSSHMVTARAQTSDGSPNLFVVMESGGIHFTVGSKSKPSGGVRSL